MGTRRDEDVERALQSARSRYALPLDARRLSEEFALRVMGVLFPHFSTAENVRGGGVPSELNEIRERLASFVVGQGWRIEDAERLGHTFVAGLAALRDVLQEDAEATYEADPAAKSVDEVILAYPGFLAIACYRIAHLLHDAGVVLLPRLITEFAHRETGVDIHPGARIGASLAIDHGTGIVVGETASIGHRVRLYQGVTIGALSVSKGLAQQKRHPTIEDDVVIYANATILGGETVIGARSVIGGNVWLTHAVPPDSIVTHGATVERSREDDESLLEYHI